MMPFVDADAHAVSGLRLHHRGDDRRVVPVIDRRAGHAPCGVEQIGGGRHAAETLLDRLELGDRHMELLANARIGAGDVGGERRAGSGQRRQRNTTPGRKRAHQHLPALAALLAPADHMVERDEDVAAPVRAVLEELHRRQMPATDLDTGQVGRHQRERDADLVLIADQMIRVGQFEREAEHGRDRTERDVALVPVEPDAQHLFPVECAAADHAGVGHGCGVRTGLRTGQTEAGDFLATRQPWKPIVALRLRAELQQQLAGAERIGHHRCHRGGERA